MFDIKHAEEYRNFGVHIAHTAVIDESNGPVWIGHGTRICHGAVLEGPLRVEPDCMIGNYSFIRGASYLGRGVRVGFGTEVKGSLIEDRVTIGPQCFISDSFVSRDVYLGAQVRTSNHRLDRKTVSVLHNNKLIDTGREKLGCFIGERASIGVQVIILPGRVIAADTTLSPRITVERNLPTGHYRLHQEIFKTNV